MATTGREGIQLGGARRFDVALVDLNLPDVSGVDVVRELRALGCDTRMIIVTAFPAFESAFDASAARADGYVDGPLFGDEVIDLVEHALKGPFPVRRPRESGPFCGDAKPRVASAIDPRVRDALRLIDGNLAGSWSNTVIAATVGLSESRLRYLFDACTGLSIAAYIRERRLREAARRLTSTFGDVRQIASQVGFASMSLGDFRRVFRERFGMSPTEYRSRHWRGSPPRV